MNKEMIENILKQWSEDNTPELYTPYREGDCVFVYGESSGVVISPYEDNCPDLYFTFLVKDDEFYYYIDDVNIKPVYWIEDVIKCLEIAHKYLQENSTQWLVHGLKYSLPWKDTENYKETITNFLITRK